MMEGRALLAKIPYAETGEEVGAWWSVVRACLQCPLEQKVWQEPSHRDGDAMNRILTIGLGLAVLGCLGCSKDALSDYSLGTEAYPNVPDCRQAYFKGKPIPGLFLKKLHKADGSRLEGVACHGVNIVVDTRTGSWKEGNL